LHGSFGFKFILSSEKRTLLAKILKYFGIGENHPKYTQNTSLINDFNQMLPLF